MNQKNLSVYFKSGANPLSVGTLSFIDDGAGKRFSLFCYDTEWLNSGFALSRELPLVAKVFKSNPRFPYFSFLYDLFPGTAAQRLARHTRGQQPDIIELLEDACEALRPGALRFKVEDEPLLSAKGIGEIALDLERLMRGHSKISHIDSLYNGVSALPGEQIKLGYVSGKNKNVIAKFTTPDPDRQLVQWEAVALSLAKRCGLKTVTADFTHLRGQMVLVSERFDRDEKNNPIGFATAQALLGASPDEYHSYLEVADILNEDGAQPREDLRELWERMVFNMTVGNVNDRLDNIGFLRTQSGWRLSPIYSIRPTPLTVARRHHATGVTADCDAPSIEKAVSVAPYFGLTKRQARERALEIVGFCGANWKKIAQNLMCDPIEIDIMHRAFERLPA